MRSQFTLLGRALDATARNRVSSFVPAGLDAVQAPKGEDVPTRPTALEVAKTGNAPEIPPPTSSPPTPSMDLSDFGRDGSTNDD